MPHRIHPSFPSSARAALLLRVALGFWLCLGGLQVPSLHGADAPRPAPPVPPVLPPVPRSPVEIFRELLAASPAQREAFLASRAPAARKTIEAKLKEFEPLTPNQRELRLQLAQLHFYLAPLLRKDPATRDTEAELNRTPGPVRSLIRDRLQSWDQLPPESRRLFLENELALARFTQFDTASPNNPPSNRESLLPNSPTNSDPSLARWLALPPEIRQQAARDFNRFFQLSHSEQERALRTLSESERKEMEISLKRFAALPPETREQCLRSFPKFANLSDDQRNEFLRSVARWQTLSPDERDAWRHLVRTLPPLPPIPPPPVERAPLVVTNSPAATPISPAPRSTLPPSEPR